MKKVHLMLVAAGVALSLGLGGAARAQERLTRQGNSSAGTAAQERLTRWVNPFVGTDGFGNVYPGAQIPFGGIQISPDTDDYDYDSAAGYKYSKPTILGFSLTHLSGTGIPDLGDFLFVPGTGTLRPGTGTETDPDSGYRSRFSHDKEAASPGYLCK